MLVSLHLDSRLELMGLVQHHIRCLLLWLHCIELHRLILHLKLLLGHLHHRLHHGLLHLWLHLKRRKLLLLSLRLGLRLSKTIRKWIKWLWLDLMCLMLGLVDRKNI
jgi:hypothetical protein